MSPSHSSCLMQKLSSDIADQRHKESVVALRDEVEAKASEAATAAVQQAAGQLPLGSSSQWRGAPPPPPSELSRKQLEELVAFMLPSEVSKWGLRVWKRCRSQLRCKYWYS
jgi:hypothetical protein